MKFAKVQFASSEARIRALELLMPRAKVVALRDSVYIVPEPALDVLKVNQIPHTVLQILHQDDVLQALRNTLAHPV
jgi:hypothetical protein